MRLIFKITFTLFLLYNYSAKSQTKAKIEYKIVFDITNFSKEFRAKYPDVIEMYEQEKKREDELTFVLFIDDKKSLFYHPPVDQSDEDLYLIYGQAEGGNIFFTDLKSKKVVEQFEYWNKKIEIETPTDEFPWILTNEKKKIQNYTCYKAVKEINIDTNGKPYAVNVEVWYTEDIPLHFGPKDYNGLPGLILELRENDMTYYVSRIDFNNNGSVALPSFSGEKMTRKQFIQKAPEIKERAKQMIINSRG